MIKIIETDGKSQDFNSLCKMLDDYIDELAGGRDKRAEYIQYNTTEDINNVLVAYDDGTPVGCMGYKYYSDGVAEIKRVFVLKDYQGKGISKGLMLKLEHAAKRDGYSKLILETGYALKAAMGLYFSCGYKIIPNYGPYESMTESVCMEKKIQC